MIVEEAIPCPECGRPLYWWDNIDKLTCNPKHGGCGHVKNNIICGGRLL